MVKKLQDILKKITTISIAEDCAGITRCKGGCGTTLEYKNCPDFEHAEYCDECFDFIFARR